MVDPGVGTERALLYVEAGGQRLLVPDNGCWTLLAGERPRVIRLAEPRFWRQPVSATFHGRDVLAPVAAHLSLGTDPALLGPPARDWVRLAVPAPRPVMNGFTGEIVFIDDFGNIITNIPADWSEVPDVLTVGDLTLTRSFRWVRTYGEATPGTLVALPSSIGLLEIAVARGNAAERLGATVGQPVTIGWAK